MSISELIRLIIVSIAVTVFVFFRCKSIFEEKDQPPQDHITSGKVACQYPQ